MVIGEMIGEEQLQEFRMIYHDTIPIISTEPGIKVGMMMAEEVSNMVILITVWDSLDVSIRFHCSSPYSEFVAKTQHLIVGDFVVKVFRKQ